MLHTILENYFLPTAIIAVSLSFFFGVRSAVGLFAVAVFTASLYKVLVFEDLTGVLEALGGVLVVAVMSSTHSVEKS